MGSTIETETWQPGKVIPNKLNTNITYLTVTNYWTPLYKNNKEEETKENEIHIMQTTKARQRSKLKGGHNKENGNMKKGVSRNNRT
jgi:hypothetical protein